MIENLLLLEREHFNSKNSTPCAHGFLEYRELKFKCADCLKEITENEFPVLFKQETDKMNALGDRDHSEVTVTMDRGITFEFLVKFCNVFDLWNVSIAEARRNFIVPITWDKRCRFVDLPVMKGKEIVGRADTYIVYASQSKFGDLVSAISEGADPKRRVWLDLFACRQWPCSKSDYFFEYAIQRCPSFFVFCPDPPELLSCSDISGL